MLDLIDEDQDRTEKVVGHFGAPDNLSEANIHGNENLTFDQHRDGSKSMRSVRSS